MERLFLFFLFLAISLAQLHYRPSYVYPRSLSYNQQPIWASQVGYRPIYQGFPGYQNQNANRAIPISSGHPMFPWGTSGIYGTSIRPNPAVVQPPPNQMGSSTCPKGPYATFLSQQEQEGLHELIVEARNTGANEAQLKEYINRYMQAVLSQDKYNQFLDAMQTFQSNMRIRF